MVGGSDFCPLTILYGDDRLRGEKEDSNGRVGNVSFLVKTRGKTQMQIFLHVQKPRLLTHSHQLLFQHSPKNVMPSTSDDYGPMRGVIKQ